MTINDARSLINEIENRTKSYQSKINSAQSQTNELVSIISKVIYEIPNLVKEDNIVSYTVSSLETSMDLCEKAITSSEEALTNLSIDATKKIKNIVDEYNSNRKEDEPYLDYNEVNLSGSRGTSTVYKAPTTSDSIEETNNEVVEENNIVVEDNSIIESDNTNTSEGETTEDSLSGDVTIIVDDKEDTSSNDVTLVDNSSNNSNNYLDNFYSLFSDKALDDSWASNVNSILKNTVFNDVISRFSYENGVIKCYFKDGRSYQFQNTKECLSFLKNLIQNIGITRNYDNSLAVNR